ncbi:MAG: Sjogren's syndrome/scleroderma autoantigen 1 family protein [Candidatus Bathyarchaeota archaeon]|nr:Sjogren's syndrome/scleroderma autoantigen 1 family protein [Candidatus Bathyarchaeota archaeon]
MPRDEEEKHMERMVNLLRQGSTLTDLACPACASPLFRLKNGELWCAKCEKKVIVIKEGEEAAKIASSMAMESLEKTMLEKIQEIQDKMRNEQNIDELQKLGTALNGLLETLEKVRKTKNI